MELGEARYDQLSKRRTSVALVSKRVEKRNSRTLHKRGFADQQISSGSSILLIQRKSKDQNWVMIVKRHDVIGRLALKEIEGL